MVDTQIIRLIDVFVIAPILIFVALKYKMPNGMRVILIVIGLMTLFYNGINYLEEQNNRG